MLKIFFEKMLQKNLTFSIKFRKHKNLELNLFTYYIKFNSEKIKLRRD